jgi:hypothetical protein
LYVCFCTFVFVVVRLFLYVCFVLMVNFVGRPGGAISPDGSVYGVLFPTRGFGDIDVKADGRPVIVATPAGVGLESAPYKLQTNAETFLVAATDGLWDFATDGEVSATVIKGFAVVESFFLFFHYCIYIRLCGAGKEDARDHCERAHLSGAAWRQRR